MRIETAWSTQKNTDNAVETAYRQLIDKLELSPSILFVYPSVEHEPMEIMNAIKKHALGVPVHGGTSCLGVMTADGFHSEEGIGLGLLGIYDPEGDYGIGMVKIEDSAYRAGELAIQQAIENAGRSGEPPDLVWLNCAPGLEEDVLRGIENVIGEKIPIAGGSIADNDVGGHWYQFTNEGIERNGIVTTVLYPSTKTHMAFHSGYTPTEFKGLVTRAEGRKLCEIDGLPAAEVYNKWTNGVIKDFLEGGNILMTTTLFPLGRIVGTVGEFPYYQLSHPEKVTDDGAITLFSRITSGEEVTLMKGSVESLVSRAGRVAQSALAFENVETDKISGALVVYCAGCMLTVQEQMDLVAKEVNQALGGNPFLGIFTFGEQGCFLHGENRHGNLMISVVVFE